MPRSLVWTAIFYCIFLALLMCGIAANAQSPQELPSAEPGGIYTSASGQLVFLERDNSDIFEGRLWEGDFLSGVGASGAVGYYFPRTNYRIELEGSYRVSENNYNLGSALNIEGTSRVLTLLLNGYYDIPLSPIWVPYVGLGAGVISRDDLSDRGMAYQIMLGITYKASSAFELFGGFRYIGSAQDEGLADYALKENYYAQTAEIGVRFRLN